MSVTHALTSSELRRMKQVRVTHKPMCDLHPERPAKFNSPTTRDAGYGGRWAYLCGSCFAQIGIETSVTEELIHVEA